jgi:predicted nucleotidyltransferase
MNHNEHTKQQDFILAQTIRILNSDNRVLGIVAAGSYARGERDGFSDLDIGCYLRDEERTGRAELYNQVGAVAPLLCHLWIYDVHALYLFESGVRLDLGFYKPSDIQKNTWYLRSNTAILYDPDGTLAQLLPLTDQPAIAAHPKWFQPGDATFVNWFFWMFRQVVCWAKRGAQGGYRAFNKLSSAAESLAEVRSRLIEMRLWTLGVSDYLGRVDPEFAQRIAETYPHLDPVELITCAKLLRDEYERICPAYCQKAGISYPSRKVEVMRDLLAEFERLD